MTISKSVHVSLNESYSNLCNFIDSPMKNAKFDDPVTALQTLTSGLAITCLGISGAAFMLVGCAYLEDKVVGLITFDTFTTPGALILLPAVPFLLSMAKICLVIAAGASLLYMGTTALKVCIDVNRCSPNANSAVSERLSPDRT